MVIKPICYMCGQELKEFGAILFGPPDESSKVEKFHLCEECYEEIEGIIKCQRSYTLD